MEKRGLSSHAGVLTAWVSVMVVWVAGVAAHTLSSGKKLMNEAPVPRHNQTLWPDVISRDDNYALLRKVEKASLHDATEGRIHGSPSSDGGTTLNDRDDIDLTYDHRTIGLDNRTSGAQKSSDVIVSVGRTNRDDGLSKGENYELRSIDDINIGLDMIDNNSSNMEISNVNDDISKIESKKDLERTISESNYTVINSIKCPSNTTSNYSNNSENESSSICITQGNLDMPGNAISRSTASVEINEMESSDSPNANQSSNSEGASTDNTSDEWSECPHLQPSFLVEAGFRRAVARSDRRCARFWCEQVLGSEARHHLGGVYHVVQMEYIAEDDHACLLNITRMIVLHHSWPMCSTDFVCATNHSTFAMSASDCMPVQCRSAETAVLVFMVLSTITIVVMSFVIMAVIIMCPQFHKPKYYLRFSLAATDLLIGIIVCGHAAYNQWVGLSEVPFERFQYYANLRDGQLFRHVPNCLWGVSDVLTQISGFFVTSGMIISLHTLSLMSLDRYLLLTRTHYRSLVTARRVSVAIAFSWCCGLAVPSLHFIYRPQKQHDICVNYDTSSLDVHIINNESKIATADYKVYLMHAVPLSVTLVTIGLPVFSLLVFSCRTLRKYKSYTRDRSVRQVKYALQLTQNSLSRQASATSLANMVTLSVGTPSPAHYHHSKVRTQNHSSPAYKLKFTSKKKKSEENVRGERGYPAATATSSLMNLGENGYEREGEAGRASSRNCRSSLIARQSRQSSGAEAATALTHETEVDTGPGSVEGAESDGGSVVAFSPFRGSVLDVLGLRRFLTMHHTHTDHVTATIRRLRGRGGEERMSVRDRDREITCTVLVNIVVFIFACFPLLGVGGWMMFLYFTQQDTINNKAPLKQLLFVAPWLMALNSLWNAILHFTYNNKFRCAACRLIATTWRKIFSVCRRRARYQA